MQPFEYVILFFGLCLLHGLLRAFYDTGKADASPGNQVFMIPEGFGRFGVYTSPFNPDPGFTDKLFEDVIQSPPVEVKIPTTVPEALKDEPEDVWEKVDYKVTKQAFKINSELATCADTIGNKGTFKITAPAPEPSGFLHTTLELLQQAAIESEKFRKAVKESKTIMSEFGTVVEKFRVKADVTKFQRIRDKAREALSKYHDCLIKKVFKL